jgi:chorismate mutase/prephenate dehydratase
MSNPVSTVQDQPGADAPAPDANEAQDAQDGWRSGGLPALRAELDRIDNAVHDLLMQRAEIVEYVARSGKPAAFRPGREAAIIRRLLGRHQGALPPVALVRIWRELLAGTTGMQGGFSLSVCDADPGVPVTQLAREHFGALTPLHAYADPGQALAAVALGHAAVAVLALPSDTEDWWLGLLDQQPRLFIIGRLPFWQQRPVGFPDVQALVVAATPADASGADESLVALEWAHDVSRTRGLEAVMAAGLKPGTMILARRHGGAAHWLVAVAGSLADDDGRLARLEPIVRRAVVLGSYALPIEGPIAGGAA